MKWRGGQISLLLMRKSIFKDIPSSNLGPFLHFPVPLSGDHLGTILIFPLRMFPAGPKKKQCTLCRKDLEVMDQKVTMEGHTVHRACFKCAICDTPLQEGIRCAFDHVLYPHWGPQWFCLAHKSLGSGEKYEMMVAKLGKPQKGGPAKI